jgi:PKD repeat protein
MHRRRFPLSSPLILAALVLAAAPLAATTWERLVPAAAHSPGAVGSFFETDLVLSNPTRFPASATVHFLEREKDNSSLGSSISVPLPSGASTTLRDVVGTIGAGAPLAGALLVRSDQPLVVRSRTYNVATLDGGLATWGQPLDGVAPEEAFGAGETAQLLGLRGTAPFRSNIGISSFSDMPVDVTVTLRDAASAFLAERSYTLPPRSVHQINDVFALFGVTPPAEPIRAEVTTRTSGARIVPYGSVVDGATGDPTTLVPLGGDDAATRLVFPSAAHAEGAVGAFFVTDSVFWNPTEDEMTVRLAFRPFGVSEPTAEASLLLAAHRQMMVDDLLGGGLFGLEVAVGSVEVKSSSPILAASRIFNRNARGAAGETGTAGQEMPALPGGLRACGEGDLIGLEKAEGIRTNAGVSNLGGTSSDFLLSLYDREGTLLGERAFSFGPFETRQFNDVVGQLFGLSAISEGRLRIVPLCGAAARAAGEAELVLYGSSVDNRSGDPTTLLFEPIGPLSSACSISSASGIAPFAVDLGAVVEGAWGDLVSAGWDFGDGTTGTGTSAHHTFVAPGIYSPRFSAEDAVGHRTGCLATATVLSHYLLSCEATPRRGKAPLDVEFWGEASGGTAPYQYRWDFGDGTGADGSVLSHTYTKGGFFTATLSSKAANGVVESCTKDITVLDCPVPTVHTFVVTPTTICAGGSASLSWKVLDADTVTIEPGIGSVAAQGTMTVFPTGTTVYVLTGTSECGSVTAKVTLAVTPVPSVTAVHVVPNPVTFGSNAILSLTIANGGTCVLTSALGNPIVPSTFVTPEGTMKVSYKATTATGTDTVTITNTNKCATTTVTTTVVVN